MRRVAALPLFLLVLLLCTTTSEADFAKGPAKRHKGARFTAMDAAADKRRLDCALRVNEQGPPCTSSAVERENCVLKCTSPACYDRVYGTDALEEGEIDVLRGRVFRACVRAEVRSEQMKIDWAKQQTPR